MQIFEKVHEQEVKADDVSSNHKLFGERSDLYDSFGLRKEETGCR